MKEKMAKLRPAFSKTGTITAANASKINDGGCSLSKISFSFKIFKFLIVLASEEKVKEYNLTPLARIVSYADAETDPIDFCIAPEKSG